MYKYKTDNVLYCSVFQKGLDIYDLNKPELPPITITISTNIFKIEAWDDKHLLLFHAQGIMLFNTETKIINEIGGLVFQYFAAPNLQAAIHFESTKYLIGLNNKIFQFRNLQFIEPFSEEYFEGEITCFGEDEKNKIYVGTSKGLYVLNEKNKKILIIPNVYVKHILKTQDKINLNNLHCKVAKRFYEY